MPQNEVYNRRCWLALRGKKMRFQGEADLPGTSRPNLVDDDTKSWLSARTFVEQVSDDHNFATIDTPESTKATVFTMYSSNSHPAQVSLRYDPIRYC